MLNIILSKSASKFINKLKDNEVKQRINNKIQDLEKDPFPSDAIRVKFRKDEKVFRIRVGDYRILYFIVSDKNLLIIDYIDKRERIYD